MRAVHEAGANTRMHEYARPGGNRGWNRQDAKSAKVFFSFPLRPLRLCGSNLRNRQRGPSTKRTRIRECTNTPGPVAIAVGTAKTPRARRFSFSPFLCALCAFAVQISGTANAGRPRSGREYANARMRPAPRQSRLEPPRRQERESLLFLSFAPFAPLRFKSPEPPTREVLLHRPEPCAIPRGAPRHAPAVASAQAERSRNRPQRSSFSRRRPRR